MPSETQKSTQKLQPNQNNRQSSHEKPNSNSLPKSYPSHSHATAILFSMHRVWLNYACNSASPPLHLRVRVTYYISSKENLKNT